MKRQLFISIAISVLLVGVPVEAKRVGSGNSIGKQSSTVTKNQSSLPAKPAAAPVSAAKPVTPAPATPVAPPSAFGGMGGILGGIAAGIGLSYLFSHMGLDGLGDGIASMVSGLLLFGILALVGFWLYKKFAPKDKDNTDMLPTAKSPTVT
jgi:predicted lipid-binding transport protein (Tim44 family)